MVGAWYPLPELTTEEQKELPNADRVAAIVVAAGASTRMEGVDKTIVELAGMPVIARTIDVFERCDAVGAIVLVVAQVILNDVAEIARVRQWKKVLHVRIGGSRRQDSVRIGLRGLPEGDWVIVHDGARPLVTDKMIRAGLIAAQATGAATAAIPSTDTVKKVSDDGIVTETLNRRSIALVQTPQVFRRDLLQDAHSNISGDVTDDAAMVEQRGAHVQVFVGGPSNIKITTPDDLVVAEALLAARETSP
jgi:2-C-methyl-D-erythritol 4-phosphate cytidylyltransferase